MSRKHIEQMNKSEVGFLHGFIRANASKVWSGKQHFYDRAAERSFKLADAQAVVSGGLVVEIHDDRKPDVRVLLRRKGQGTCVVLSLTTWEVVTVYYNAPEDQHRGLNWSAYRWNQDVVSLVKGLR